MRPFRLAAYHTSACISFIALLLTIIALSRTDYIYSDTPGTNEPLFETKYGLFQRCDRIADSQKWKCRRFPKRRLDCPVKPRAAVSETARLHFSNLMGLRKPEDDFMQYEDLQQESGSHLCQWWISSGYAAELSVPFAAAATIAAIAYTLPQIRTKQRKKHGWKVCAVLTSLHAVLQIISTAIIAHLFRTDSRFSTGSRLGAGWILSTVSYSTSVILIIGLIAAESFGLARSRKRSMSAPPDERQPLLAEQQR